MKNLKPCGFIITRFQIFITEEAKLRKQCKGTISPHFVFSKILFFEFGPFLLALGACQDSLYELHTPQTIVHIRKVQSQGTGF